MNVNRAILQKSKDASVIERRSRHDKALEDRHQRESAALFGTVGPVPGSVNVSLGVRTPTKRRETWATVRPERRKKQRPSRFYNARGRKAKGVRGAGVQAGSGAGVGLGSGSKVGAGRLGAPVGGKGVPVAGSAGRLGVGAGRGRLAASAVPAAVGAGGAVGTGGAVGAGRAIGTVGAVKVERRTPEVLKYSIRYLANRTTKQGLHRGRRTKHFKDRQEGKVTLDWFLKGLRALQGKSWSARQARRRRVVQARRRGILRVEELWRRARKKRRLPVSVSSRKKGGQVVQVPESVSLEDQERRGAERRRTVLRQRLRRSGGVLGDHLLLERLLTRRGSSDSIQRRRDFEKQVVAALPALRLGSDEEGAEEEDTGSSSSTAAWELKEARKVSRVGYGALAREKARSHRAKHSARYQQTGRRRKGKRAVLLRGKGRR